MIRYFISLLQALKPRPAFQVLVVAEQKAIGRKSYETNYLIKQLGEAGVEAGKAMQNAGKSMMSCTGCAPAIFIPDQQVRDLNKCPKCGSQAVKKEIVEHTVP